MNDLRPDPVTVPGSPWHAGERALQREAGAAERLGPIGARIFRDHMSEQQQAFYPHLPFLVVGAVDPAGAVWASVLAGRPGFLAVPDPGTLAVAAARDPADPADAGLGDGDAVGLLGIELHSRRRNRLNGAVHRTGPAGFRVAVRESFGNCPRYIRRREAHLRDPAEGPARPAERRDSLDADDRAAIARADTAFLASYADLPEGRRVDVSHRGGPLGFVHVEVDGTLTIPDYAGNAYFNTLGNIWLNPRAGLAIVDFARGDLLQISGRADVVLDAEARAAFPGAERLLRIRPDQVVFRPDALPLRWAVDQSTGMAPATVIRAPEV